MPQYLVANYLPDDFDPSTVTEAMIEEIHALNREMIAAGVRKFACGISPAATPRRCGSSPMVRCSSPTGRTPRPRSTWAVSGYWKLPIWTRRSRGRARAPSPAMRWARCASFFSSRTRREQRNSLTAAALVRAACARKPVSKETAMRKIKIMEHITLDGVIQAPGGPDEDGDYPYGGWAGPHADPDGGAAIVEASRREVSICCWAGEPTTSLAASGRKLRRVRWRTD